MVKQLPLIIQKVHKVQTSNALVLNSFMYPTRSKPTTDIIALTLNQNFSISNIFLHENGTQTVIILTTQL